MGERLPHLEGDMFFVAAIAAQRIWTVLTVPADVRTWRATLVQAEMDRRVSAWTMREVTA